MIPAPFLKAIVATPKIEVHQTVQPQVQQTQKIDDELKVTFDDSVYDAVTGEFVMTGNVTAVYGPTVIRCPKLRINVQKKKGVAEGGVTVTDPEGHVTASRCEFDWKAKTGTLSDVVLQADNVHIEAQTMTVVPDKWELTRAKGSLSRVKTAPVSFSADSVTIVPGRYGVARHVFLNVYGTKIGPLPRLSFQLRKRLKGLGLPSLTNRKGLGFGISWEASFAAGDHGALSGFWDAFPKREPGFGVQYGYSPLSPDSATLISPRSDLGERFSDGWFDNIGVRTPAEEHDELTVERRSYAVASFWNQSTTARPKDSDNVSKSFQLTAENGGIFRGIGTYGQLQVQSIRDATSNPFVTRATGQGTLLAPPVKINRSISAHMRLDGFGSMSDRGTYAWGRLETGLIFQPNKDFSFGLGYALGSGIGTPDFKFDGLIADQMLMMRADFHFGPFTARYLNKFNIDTRTWYDREYEIALVAREFEPFIAYRQFPSETRLGIRFRIDNLRDRLTRRKQGR